MGFAPRPLHRFAVPLPRRRGRTRRRNLLSSPVQRGRWREATEGAW